MKHPFVLLALLACFAIAVLAYTPAQASSPTVAVVSSQPEAPSQTCWGCGPVPQPGGVFDRGPRPHATGYVNGSYYCVAVGDTLFSISQRFGVSAQQIAAANGIPNPWLIWANQFILIPGLGIAPVTPTPPTVTPIPQQPSITISSPTANSSLPATFQVSGVATGPNGATIAVQAQDNNISPKVLSDATTTLQTTSGSFGSGSWSVSLTVNQVVAGRIVAALVGQPIGAANVPVTFNGGSSQQLVITQPAQNAQLPANFIVSGTGSNLSGNQVSVQAVTNGGTVLQTQQTFLQNIQPNGQGTWQVTFSNVSAGAPTLGRIVASAPGSTVAPQSVNVTFNGVALQQLTITQPTQGPVSRTFTVVGTGTNLPNNRVTVEVRDESTAVRGSGLALVQNIQPNGQGTWQVTINNISPGPQFFGQIRASAEFGSTAPPAIVNNVIIGGSVQ